MVILLFITACGGSGEGDSVPVISETVAPTVATGIDADTLMAEIEILSSDEFGGRAPGSPGEVLTIEYLTKQFSNLGLEPGNPGGGWVQGVPLVGITPQTGSEFQVTMDGDSLKLEPGKDYVAWTKHVVDQVEIDAEFVFVGYGAVAPEYEWDDFGDVDVEGKILLFLVNDPPLDDVFGGPAMTYYGRWTYKHEIAAERGAAGTIGRRRKRMRGLRRGAAAARGGRDRRLPRPHPGRRRAYRRSGRRLARSSFMSPDQPAIHGKWSGAVPLASHLTSSRPTIISAGLQWKVGFSGLPPNRFLRWRDWILMSSRRGPPTVLFSQSHCG